MALTLHIEAAADGGWSLALHHPERPIVTAKVPRAIVEAIGEHCATVHRRSRTPMAVPGVDAELVAAEEGLGRALAMVLGTAPSVARLAGAVLGRAEGAGEVPVLALDTPVAEIAALPWELLAEDDGASLETLQRVLIGRISQPGTSRRGEARPSVRVWCPTPDNPECGRLVRSLARVVGQAGLGVVESVDEEVSDSTGILHVVCHGWVQAGRSLAMLEGDIGGAGQVAERILPQVQTALLVVLDVCEGGASGAAAVDSLACRLVAHGASLVVAPFRACSLEAVESFHHGLYHALGEGSCVARAILRGRAGVRALNHPREHSRWYNHRLYLGREAEFALGWRPPRRWHPPAWPHPSVEAAAFLATALHASAAVGFVGVEHLACALHAARWSASLVPLLRRALTMPKAETWYARREGATTMPRVSPRLAHVSKRLPEAFSIDDLWQAVADEGGHPLALAARHAIASRLGDTVPASWIEGVVRSSVPARTLEVIGGPHDGYLLSAGTVLGRAREAAVGTLYADTLVWDPALSGSHAVWRGDSTLEIQKPAVLIQNGVWHAVEAGVVELEDGSEFLLGNTRFRAHA